MELSECNAIISLNLNLLNNDLIHSINKNAITILEFKCDINPITKEYFVNTLVKHHLTGSLEFLDFNFIKKYYL
jgi:hypothetical protein